MLCALIVFVRAQSIVLPMINTQSESLPEGKRKIILLLEDHEPYRQIVIMALGFHLNGEVDIVEAAGIQEANSVLQRLKLDLVVADVMLMDGTISELLKHAQFENGLKVILFSNHSQETMRAMCHSKQVVDRISKEEGLVALALKIRQALE